MQEDKEAKIKEYDSKIARVDLSIKRALEGDRQLRISKLRFYRRQLSRRRQRLIDGVEPKKVVDMTKKRKAGKSKSSTPKSVSKIGKMMDRSKRRSK